MWELDCEESWSPKNWCFWTVVFEKILESPSDCKEIQLVHSEGDQSWVFIGRTDAKAETPILWPPDVKSWLIGKDPDAGRDWGQEEKEMTEDEMAGWHHRLDGHEFEWTPGVGDGQGGLSCCDSWGGKESDTTEWLSWTELMNVLNATELQILCYEYFTTINFLKAKLLRISRWWQSLKPSMGPSPAVHLVCPPVKVVPLTCLILLPFNAGVKWENATSWFLEEHQGDTNGSRWDKETNGTGRWPLCCCHFQVLTALDWVPQVGESERKYW